MQPKICDSLADQGNAYPLKSKNEITPHQHTYYSTENGGGRICSIFRQNPSRFEIPRSFSNSQSNTNTNKDTQESILVENSAPFQSRNNCKNMSEISSSQQPRDKPASSCVILLQISNVRLLLYSIFVSLFLSAGATLFLALEEPFELELHSHVLRTRLEFIEKHRECFTGIISLKLFLYLNLI